MGQTNYLQFLAPVLPVEKVEETVGFDIPQESTAVSHQPEIDLPVSVNQQVFPSGLINNGGECSTGLFIKG